MAIELTDDGTLDMVLRCTECGEEMRYNYDPSANDDGSESEHVLTYDEFVTWAIEDATAEHECSADSEPTEPEEGDITTEDHETFYQYGRPCLRAVESSTGEYWEYHKEHASNSARWQPLGRFASVEQALKAFMVAEQFWPNAWFISDHGNAHRIDLTEEK